MKRFFTLVIAAGLLVAAGCSKSDEGDDSGKRPPEESEDIVVVDGKVRFYLSIDETSPSLKMGADPHRWSARDKVRVNNKLYSVQIDDQKRPYLDVNAADDKVYRAGFYTQNKYFASSCFTGVFLPHAQYYKSAGYALTDYPLYAVYTQTTGNKLIFKDGYGALAVSLKGSAAISSIKVEDASGAYLGGNYNFDASTAALVAAEQSGVGFVTLNCTDEGEGVDISSAEKTFYVILPARNYASGLRLTICDRSHRAMFHDVAALNLAPGTAHPVSLDYAPAADLVFYEGFDTFVWGGDIIGGGEAAGYAPSDARIGIDDGTEYTGYEEALVPVACDNPGSGFMQPNAWDSSKNVAQNHQMSESYLRSRNLFDWQNLFRCQEYQGCLAVGAGNTARGLLQTCAFSHIEGIRTVEISFKFCLQANITDDLLCQVVNGGRITACELNGTDLPLTAENSGYVSNQSNLTVSRSMVEIPTSASQPKTWNRVTLTVEGASDGTGLYLASVLTTAGVHGIYFDEITVRKGPEMTVGPNNLRVLYWNIQNGMWSDQGNNYDNFVKWVKRYDPDVCVWCEAQSNYKTGSNSSLPAADRFLPNGWGTLAARYGHTYWTKSAHRDNFPQVITSKHPITKIVNIDGAGSDVTVSHGACQASITVGGKEVHIVTLHLWPQSYAYGAADQAASTAENGGDKYRAREMAEILRQSVNNPTQSGVTNWLVMGDFNSRSPLDNWFYNYPADDTRLLVHQYIADHTRLVDIIAARYPGSFVSSTGGSSRIDYMFASEAMYDRIDNAFSVMDSYTTPIQSTSISNFYHPSDHRPILVDFDMK